MSFKLRDLFKLFILFMICSVLCISTVSSVNLYAGANYNTLDDEAKETAKRLYLYLVANDYSAECALGILGNADQESTFSSSVNTDNGSYHGYFQMSSGQWSSMKSWASAHNLKYTDIVVQYRYIEEHLESDFRTYVGSHTMAQWKTTSSVTVGMEGFMIAYERCLTSEGVAGYKPKRVTPASTWAHRNYQEGDLRNTYAMSFMSPFTNLDPSEYNEDDEIGALNQKGQMGTSAISRGSDLYDERDLAAMRIIAETDVEEDYLCFDRSDLMQNDLANMANWENNVHNNVSKSDPIYWLRVATMLLGILLIVYSVLLYLAYWFDRINVFVDIDLLGILTLGRLHMSDTEEDCNFNMSLNEGEKKTVNHVAVIKICIIGIAFGTLIISGFLYKALSYLVNLILIALGQN